MRVAIPTKDRPGNLAACLTTLAVSLVPGDELFLYDDGDRPGTADYGTRFALDLALQRGVSVVIKRGKPNGIKAARVQILKDARHDGTVQLLMVDDDIIVDSTVIRQLTDALLDAPKIAYAVPVVALANNEAFVSNFSNTGPSAEHQQFQLDGKGVVAVKYGAWTCAILLQLNRFDLDETISHLELGPEVVEDYQLTTPLPGVVHLESVVWHVMSRERPSNDWDSLALEELRKQIGGRSEKDSLPGASAFG